MFLKRTVTTLILGSSVVAGIWWLPVWLFQCVVASVILLAASEWSKLMTPSTKPWCIIFMVLTILAFLVSFFFLGSIAIYIGTVAWLLSPLWLYGFVVNPSSPWMRHYSTQTVLGICALVPCWLSLSMLRFFGDLPWLLLILLFTVWLADIAAYLAGRLWGKHKLAPAISPGKTIEGALGALLAIMLVAFVTVYALPYKIHFWPWFLMLMFVFVVAVLGDLFQSTLKRQKGVKDSGSLLPGHGGILDRIDALIAASPVYFIGVLILNKYQFISGLSVGF